MTFASFQYSKAGPSENRSPSHTGRRILAPASAIWPGGPVSAVRTPQRRRNAAKQPLAVAAPSAAKKSAVSAAGNAAKQPLAVAAPSAAKKSAVSAAGNAVRKRDAVQSAARTDVPRV